MSTKRRDYEQLPDEELPEAADARARVMIEQADRDIEEARVNFRWGKTQIDIVKRAAGLLGVPYQTYMKEAVFRQAVADLRAADGLTKEDERPVA